MIADYSRGPAAACLAVFCSLVAATVVAGESSLDQLYDNCGVPFDQRSPESFKRVTIVGVASRRLREIELATLEAKKGGRVDRKDVDTAAFSTLRETHGLVCLKKKSGEYFWTYSSAVKYNCEVAATQLADATSKAGSMGVGVGGCVNDEW